MTSKTFFIGWHWCWCWVFITFLKALGGAAFLVPSTTTSRTSSVTTISPSTTTSLYVSELHVPGYSESKKAFLLTDQQDSTDSTFSTATATLETPKPSLNIQSYTNQDYTSQIPYQNGYLVHTTNKPIFNQDECQYMIHEAEYIASQRDWTRNRHGNFPTTDLPLIELPYTLEFLKIALIERLYPLLTQQFGIYLPDASKLRVVDGFIVKYDANGGQTELKPHRDGSVLSFNIALNPSYEYTGGGTWFHSLNKAITIEQGHVVSHASGLLHGGHGITSGKRYILVAFVILEGYDSWSMRFYNQIRNL